VIGYYDPINLATIDLYGQGEEASIGFLRQGERSPRTSSSRPQRVATGAHTRTWQKADAAAVIGGDDSNGSSS
jgi:hypothetical protein